MFYNAGDKNQSPGNLNGGEEKMLMALAASPRTSIKHIILQPWPACIANLSKLCFMQQVLKPPSPARFIKFDASATFLDC